MKAQTKTNNKGENMSETMNAATAAQPEFKNVLEGTAGAGANGRLIFASTSKGKVMLRANKEVIAELGAGDLIVQGTLEGISPNSLSKKDDYKIRGANGDLTIVNGGGNLNFLMSKVSVGQLVRISYAGTEKITSGDYKGKLANKFTVEVA